LGGSAAACEEAKTGGEIVAKKNWMLVQKP
jgi:hypothetical protein